MWIKHEGKITRDEDKFQSYWDAVANNQKDNYPEVVKRTADGKIKRDIGKSQHKESNRIGNNI